MATALTYVFFIIGLILIIKGGDIFVDSATKLANMLGVPKFIIGATIVSIATTLPEIIVSIQATLSKNVDMAVGNAIGSVTANTALILGLFITFMPFEIKRKDISFKSIAMIFAVVFIIIGCIVTQKKELSFKGEVGEYYFLSALGVTLLFTVFAIFIFENIKCIKSDESKISYCTKEKVSCTILFILGAVGIIFGARLLVKYATQIAISLNISQRVISVIAVAIGTSLPELVTSVVASRKGENGLALGNVIGSNIFNVLMVLAASAAVHPIAVTSFSVIDTVCLIVASVVTWVLCSSKLRISRGEGLAMLAMYAGYLVYICIR